MQNKEIYNQIEDILELDNVSISLAEIEEIANNQELQEQYEKKHKDSLYTRDVFDVTLEHELEEALQCHTPLCLLMIDIDDFKRINDTYGHLTGDHVLQKIGRTINKSIRDVDLAARYGGEELAIIMPTEVDKAIHVAKRIRQRIAELIFKDFQVTVSIGVSKIGANCLRNAKLTTSLLKKKLTKAGLMQLLNQRWICQTFPMMKYSGLNVHSLLIPSLMKTYIQS